MKEIVSTATSKVDEILVVLRTEILRGQYRSGERLPSERDLSARFESNRGAIREVIKIIEAAGAEPAGVLIALDRQEKGQGELSAIQEVERDFNIPVASIVNLTQVLDYIQDDASLSQYADAVSAYRSQFGIA